MNDKYVHNVQHKQQIKGCDVNANIKDVRMLPPTFRLKSGSDKKQTDDVKDRYVCV